MTYLAHSARPDRGIPEQEYRDHIENVVGNAVSKADRAAVFSAKYGDLLRAAVREAAEFHDLGKLDELNQEVLRTNRGKLKLNHVDAGVAHLLDGPPNSARIVAALAAFAHHIGLPAIAEENTKGKGNVFRDGEPAPDGTPLREFTNRRLDEYRKRHHSCLANLPLAKQLEAKIPAPQLLLRLALSCLVDADHSDTARNYRDPVADQPPSPLDAAKRLALLDEYVAQLGRGREKDKRLLLRSQVYRQCRDSDFSAGLLACDSPVGSGGCGQKPAACLRGSAIHKHYRPIRRCIPKELGPGRRGVERSRDRASPQGGV
jgi:CRISPR-associated endonuclease/helicase Cas3